MLNRLLKNLPMRSDPNNIPLETFVSADQTLRKRLHALNKLSPDEAAKSAVSLVGPRVYKLKGIKGEKLKFYVIGCSGSGKKSQIDVARLMDKMASRSKESKPDFIISAGDMFYPAPPSSPTDPLFKSNFFDIYQNPSFTTLKTVPIFACLGNHEELRFKSAKLHLNYNNLHGTNPALNVVAATYVPDGEKFETTAELVNFFQQEELDLKKLQGLNIPFYYYALQAGKVQLTFMNSNTLCKSYLDFNKIKRQPGKMKTCTEETYQVPWLQKLNEEFKDFFQIHVMHNPRYPVGKRALKPDTGLHLKPNQQKELNQELNANAEFLHEFINLILQMLNLESELHISAHEHLLDFVNTHPLGEEENAYLQPKIRQIGSGGGGGDLQAQKKYDYKDLGTVLSNTGFWEVSVDINNPKDLELTLYTVKRNLQEDEEIKPKFTLKFNLSQRLPITVPHQDERVNVMRKLLLDACYEIFHEKEALRLQGNSSVGLENHIDQGFLGYWRQKFSSLASDAVGYFFSEYQPNEDDFLHDLMAGLNNPTPPNFEKILRLYTSTLKNLPDKKLLIDAVQRQIMTTQENHENFDSQRYMELLVDDQNTPNINLVRVL